MLSPAFPVCTRHTGVFHVRLSQPAQGLTLRTQPAPGWRQLSLPRGCKFKLDGQNSGVWQSWLQSLLSTPRLVFSEGVLGSMRSSNKRMAGTLGDLILPWPSRQADLDLQTGRRELEQQLLCDLPSHHLREAPGQSPNTSVRRCILHF